MVRAELAAILESPLFSSSKRCQDLLEFVVERALEGDFESLTERFIGARVFGRPIEYETATDAIVRVRANDVRRRLSQYYSERHSRSAATISLISGSYVPEFHFHGHDRIADGDGVHEEGQPPQSAAHPEPAHEETQAATQRPLNWRRLRRPVLIGVPLLVVVAVLAGFWIRHRSAPSRAMEAFWEPVLREKSDILICAGGNTFMQSPVPEFVTAGKEIEYPYFSLQTAVSTTLLSALIERHGGTAQFRFAASTPLPEFHEHPIILLNAFNNIWTQRLVEPLRFSLTPREFRPQSIVDRMHPEINWHRDASIPYESADDYALVARFWDKTTDNWVVILAGLGRNGTEAATRFVVDPHYMQQLRERLGRDFSNRNIELVLKVSVVDGKTGAPTIMATYSW